MGPDDAGLGPFRIIVDHRCTRNTVTDHPGGNLVQLLANICSEARAPGHRSRCRIEQAPSTFEQNRRIHTQQLRNTFDIRERPSRANAEGGMPRTGGRPQPNILGQLHDGRQIHPIVWFGQTTVDVGYEQFYHLESASSLWSFVAGPLSLVSDPLSLVPCRWFLVPDPSSPVDQRLGTGDQSIG